MAKGIYVATSGSVAQLRHLETLSSNLANTRTAGFKGDRLDFETVRARSVREGGGTGADPEGLDKHYVDVRDRRTDLAAGPVTRTNNPLDVAMTANAFLTVETDKGTRLTRDGRLVLGRDGALRTQSGHAVLDASGRTIHLPPDRVPTIDEQGNIRAGDMPVGRLGLVGVDLREGLEKDLDGHFVPPDGAAALLPNAGVLQGHLEESNVRPVQAMLELVEVQRTCSALRQVTTPSGELDQLASRLPQ